MEGSEPGGFWSQAWAEGSCAAEQVPAACRGGSRAFHSHLKNQLITPEPGGFQGIHFQECLWPAGKVSWGPSHVCSFLWSPLTVSLLAFRPSPCASPPSLTPSPVGGLDPPPELVSVFSPLSQSLLNPPAHSVPVSARCALPHQPGALCSVPCPCGDWAGAAGHRNPVGESLKGRSV